MLNELPLCNVTSPNRTTPFPSNFTSKLLVCQVSFPLVFDEMMPPALPGSSPVLVLRLEPSVATEFPSIFTLFVPSARSLLLAMFTYGTGIGPAGEGVLHTSGGAAASTCPSPA